MKFIFLLINLAAFTCFGQSLQTERQLKKLFFKEDTSFLKECFFSRTDTHKWKNEHTFETVRFDADTSITYTFEDRLLSNNNERDARDAVGTGSKWKALFWKCRKTKTLQTAMYVEKSIQRRRYKIIMREYENRIIIIQLVLNK